MVRRVPPPGQIPLSLIDVAARRLAAQRLTGEPFASIVEAIGWLGAVQAQDYGGAKWALGQRSRSGTDPDIDRLFDQGLILRTHVLRPTWHFVLPTDVRWLLGLTAARVKAAMAATDRRLGIDEPLIRDSNRAIAAALGDGVYLTRNELGAILGRDGIAASGQRLGNLVMHAELDSVVVSGPRRGKQFTYALLEDRVPPADRPERDEALAELARRYFTSHGPAQAQDFAWWSGLTTADARRGLALAAGALGHEVVGGISYWTSPGGPVPSEDGPVVHLLPNFDEFLVAYRDRAAAVDPARGLDPASLPRGSILGNVVTLNGLVRGGWRRQLLGRRVVVELGTLRIGGPADEAALSQAVERYGRFLGVPVIVANLRG